MCLYNKCIPEKNLSNKKAKIHKKPWITNQGFIKSSKIKNKLYKKILNNGNEELKAKYKYYRNRLNKLKNILKRRYEQKFDTAKSDIKQTWKLVNEVISRKKKDTVSSTEFKKDNEHITDKREIVN